MEGKVALITGAASGIGKATAAKFISNGAKVVITDIQRQLGQETAAEVGPNATFFPCDVTKESEISDAVDFAVSTYNKLDIMYNNAGIYSNTFSSIADLDLAVFDRVSNINVKGVMAGIKHASRVMIPRRSGSILCTASVMGMMAGMATHPYNISKSTVIGMVRSTVAELYQHGIRINSISPFAIPTPILMKELAQRYPGLDEARLSKLVSDAGSLWGAECELEDIANAAAYLASDE